MKTVKPMYLFFDYLYETVEQIGADVVEDWSHKETPTLTYCVIDEADKDEKELSTQWAWLYDNEADAIKDMNEDNEF